MKTLKQSHTGVIIRRPDFEAAELVATGGWAYCPKHLWKEQKEESHVVNN